MSLPNHAGPASGAPPLRHFTATIFFEDNSAGQFECDSIDHLAALAKMVGAIADLPKRVTKLQFQDTTGLKVIVPGFQMQPRG